MLLWKRFEPLVWTLLHLFRFLYSNRHGGGWRVQRVWKPREIASKYVTSGPGAVHSHTLKNDATIAHHARQEKKTETREWTNPASCVLRGLKGLFLSTGRTRDSLRWTREVNMSINCDIFIYLSICIYPIFIYIHLPFFISNYNTHISYYPSFL